MSSRQHKKATRLLLVVLLCCCLPGWPGLLRASQPLTAAGLIQQGGYALAGNGRISAAQNSQTPFIPASTVKIITSLAALEILGPDHRFATRIFRDQHNNLYIKGSGDPFLLTEDVSALVRRLHEAGIREINNLIVDESAFAIAPRADGNENTANPYDAWNGGLAVNFNAITIRVAPDHSVSSDDPKLPFLPMMQAIGNTLPPGHYHLNVNAFKAKGQLSNTLRYTGELFTALMKQEKIRVRGKIMAGETPAAAAPVLTHWSAKPLREMIRLCLKYSNNFVANQLFLACGSTRLGAPATWDKARRALQEYIRDGLGIAAAELVMIEGSGLSRRNRISADAMITALQKFAPDRELLPLKKGLPLKSGTLTGVYCYAGYIPQQQDAPFVILLNQVQNNRDEILALLMNRQDKRIMTVKK
ncbi:MAG: D-alanyl-D-alanine carboxypeptidase [Pseudomonadota bacterium]